MCTCECGIRSGRSSGGEALGELAEVWGEGDAILVHLQLQALASIAWAFAHLDRESKKLVAMLAVSAERQASQFNGHFQRRGHSKGWSCGTSLRCGAARKSLMHRGWPHASS
eukprot:gnl/TRDRNA2_/TRDRNA2_173487_c3_seq13.p1 gnl/TRDRNA2_/TRDRNA2_173487_c3~~gnl/TRDRNA2_/TRDRNA2_173487_c3_seq13.p1  ORF type:complete len:112 (+),score=13.03 gnl/TRDRNA2_/TRDRNA2_173487_c3_seq13:822-1157(+)